MGFSTNGHGVLGQSDGAGTGLVGTSRSGIGVFGKGGNLAGFFEGNVEITGSLSIQGVNIQTLLQSVTAIDTRVNSLQQQVNSLLQLQQQANSLQQQLENLRQKHEQDIQGIAQSLITLAQRVTNLGG